MAFIICQRHGGHIATLACIHICDAVQRRIPLPELFYIDAWYLGESAWGYHVCPMCAREIGIIENHTIWNDDESLDRLFAMDLDVAPVCSLCFNEAKLIA